MEGLNGNRWARLSALALAGALLGGAALLKVTAEPASGETRDRTSSPAAKELDVAEEWARVDRLVGEQKFEEASSEVDGILKAARGAGDQANWTKALVRRAQLRMALHGAETAVRELKEASWPKGADHRAVLNLFYARTLLEYVNVYSWEIRQRERVASGEEVDLQSWTLDQIVSEARSAFLEVWRLREGLCGTPVEAYREYIHPNTYPGEIRGTLRDAVTYLFVGHLADSSLWTPKESNETYRLDLETLLAAEERPGGGLSILGSLFGKGGEETAVEDAVSDADVHPLEKICLLLDDLEAWHLSERKRGAALEARLERCRRLRAGFSEEEDRRRIREDLEGRLPDFRSVPWWSMGMAQLAEFVRSDGEPGSRVRARAIADEGAKRYPDSPGGQRCRHITASIESPDFSLQAMSADGPDRRSFRVNHRNLDRLYFRAYPVDLLDRLKQARDYNMLPRWREVEAIIEGSRPAHSWSVSLPPTPDYESHATYVKPPMRAPGLYVCVASARPDFARRRNRILGLNFLVTDLVLITSDRSDGSVEVRVLSGRTGEPVADAAVSLYRYDWNEGHRVADEETTGPDGYTRFRDPGGGRNQYFLMASKGEDRCLDASYYRSFHADSTEEFRSNCLIYTDRSIYRPGQTIHWKAVAYGGKSSEGDFRVRPHASVSVTLKDANGQKVETVTVSTNTYGSASGSFAVPAGRVLGSWRVETSPYGRSAIRVEEYKRPTFEVTLQDPREPLRLNRPARFAGEAKYYFGLPVTEGSVAWRVTREPVYPRWWGWFYWGRSFDTRAQSVASGAASLDEEGAFEVSFTPEADERKADEGVSYRYRVSVDVTDAGGETRSDERAFRLGFVSVEASIGMEDAFVDARAKSEVTVTRTDLNGVPRPGEGSWILFALRSPEEALLPADQPMPEPPEGEGGDRVRTAGDRLRPRWQSGYSLRADMRGWKDGGSIETGSVRHDDEGEAVIGLPRLKAGAYRLRYETADAFGETFEAQHEFVVATAHTSLEVPIAFLAQRDTVEVGDSARFWIRSGLGGQRLTLEVYRNGRLEERRDLAADSEEEILEIPVTERHRGGFSLRVSALRDHQFMSVERPVFVPWDDKDLSLEFTTFRDRFRPGDRERWRVAVKDPGGGPADAETVELLAYMYDRSLDLFAPHTPPRVASLYPRLTFSRSIRASLGVAGSAYRHEDAFVVLPDYPHFGVDRLAVFDKYGIGGPGRRMRGGTLGFAEGAVMPMSAPMPEEARERDAFDAAARAPAVDEIKSKTEALRSEEAEEAEPSTGDGASEEPEVQLRSDFSETAFWEPHLLLGPEGEAVIEFEAPDSVTSWNVWVHGVTRDLKGGSLRKEARSVKDLMVRPYLPRFLREGDRAELRVAVNNASEMPMEGVVRLEVFDPDTEEDLMAAFGFDSEGPAELPFSAKAEGGTTVVFSLRTPSRVGLAAFKVTAVSGDTGDGELRPLPVLPGRMHLSQSRFVTLREGERREMTFEDMARDDDPTLVHDSLVVTVDAQLFYGVLDALPYLVGYPYECTEQTLNRFVSTGILSSLYDDYPAVRRMAKEFSERETRLEVWDDDDPNRKMALEETPWLVVSRGGAQGNLDLIKVLDPAIAEAQRASALAKLEKAQTAIGGFPWWPGGPPSPYMTLYIMHGLAKAAEFGVDVPKDMVRRGWSYLARHYREKYADRMIRDDCCWEFLTFLNYTASCYPDDSWTGGALTQKEREAILNHCFSHWKQHSPYLKGYLALTLHRERRAADALLVFESVMDSARTTRDEGTFWAPEDRSWLWYNDTIETHAFALRTLTELSPEDPRKEGLVLWLFLNKKLNHWKSTRATAEVIYSLVHYLRDEGALGAREEITVEVGNRRTEMVFEPDAYTGKKNQVVLTGRQVDPKICSTIAVEKEGKSFAFASATWHFSTDRLPEEDRGDFFQVSRTYFLRRHEGDEFVLRPLSEGERVAVGDEIEVQVSLRSRHQAEYVHLRDPRPAGCEPVSFTSGFKWDLGLGYYEEIRDSGENFFFEALPVGQYTFKYRLRASMAGTFKVAPATVQSMYAPEFNAYSAGHRLAIEPAESQP